MYKFIITVIVSFVAGWYVNGIRLNLEFSEFKLSAEKQYTKLLEDKALNDAVLQGKIDEIQRQSAIEVNAISQRYNSLLTKYNILYSNRYSNSKDSMSNSSKITNRLTTTCKCKSPTKTRQGITEALEVGRDCDLLSEKYNRLLKIYNSYREKY